MSNQTNCILHLSSETWTKDTNGLFDYESKSKKKYELFIGDSLSIKRNGDNLNGTKDESNPNDESLFNITKSNDSIYNIETKIQGDYESIENSTYLNSKLWYIINNEPRVDTQNNHNDFQCINKDYFLNKDDIIKFGRTKFIISEINMDNDNEAIDEKIKDLSLNETNWNESNYINELNYKVDCHFDLVSKANCLADEENEIKNNSEEKELCRICFGEEIDRNNNPMIHLCHCKGDINYAHFWCIKRWMGTKLHIFEKQEKSVRSYYISNFNCEICKTPYPSKFKLNNNDKIYDLIDIKRPENSNYIILESLNQVKNNCNNKSIHVIPLKNNDEFLIGRGSHCDIVINDISVSRYHSKIKYNKKNKTLLIKDLQSKFGTLVLIKSPFEIIEPIQFQIGRTYFKASLENNNDLKNFQALNQIENEKNLEKNEQTKNENNFEPPENSIKEKNILENDNMDIEENL